jgi:hypothetical protein
MPQTIIGALKIAAKRTGTDLETYLSLINSGKRWCTGCKAWHPSSAFGIDRTIPDGLARTCLAFRRIRERSRYAPKPAEDRRYGPLPMSPRDGDAIQARQRVNVEVRTGRRPHPNTLPCVDCGHIWRIGERRHEYDHYLGYAAAHHYDVESVCTTCHHAREEQRRG